MISSQFNANGSPSGRNMAWLFSQFFRLPIVAMVYGMEMFVKTMHGLQKMTDQGVDVLTEGQSLRSNEDSISEATARVVPAPVAVKLVPPVIVSPTNTRVEEIEHSDKERTKMPDTNLNDDMLKLVRYKILFIKRDYEYAFPEQEELVWDNMSDTAFTAWKVAEFIQQLKRTKKPEKWSLKNYPPTKSESPKGESKEPGKSASASREFIDWLPEEDKKYLRVYYEVMARYSREKFKHDERQIEVLEEIRDRLPVR